MNLFALLFMPFLFLIHIMSTTGFVRDENGFKFGNFVKNPHGFVLQKPDSFITKTSTSSEDECLVDCLSDPLCFSLNVVYSSDNSYECELFKKTGNNVTSFLVARSNAYYMKLQAPPSLCDSDPCQNGGTCIMTEARTNYTCSCTPQHKGRNCEIGCVLFDFESGRLDGWTLTGTAFNNQPTYGDNPTARGRGQPSNHHGNWWIGTFENRPSPAHPAGQVQGDAPAGTMTSPSFQIHGKQLTFLIGGGNDVNAARMELLIGGQVVARETGDMSETMVQKSWNVTLYRGKIAQVRLVDNSGAVWAHINVDYIVDSYCTEP